MNTLKKLFSAQDMTQGTPWKRIAQFAVPLLIGNFAQQLYSTVDTIVVGKYVGDNALAAVGSTGPILNLLIVLFVGISVGAGIMVAQYFGAKEREHLSRCIGVCICLTAIVSVLIMVVAPLVSRWFLELLSTPDTIIDWAEEYLNVLFWGIAGLTFYNILSGILRGLGDSLTALLILLVSSCMNIVLDVWFVASFNLGVAGVAYATIISQSVSSLLCLWKLSRMRDVFDFKWKYIRVDRHYAGKLIRLGLPSGASQAIFSLALVMVQSLTNQFGEAIIACNVIIMRVDGFAMLPNFTFGNTMTTFTGQNIGANRLDRVHTGTRQGLLMAVATATVLTTAIMVFGRSLMGLFTDTAELIDLSMYMMSIIAFGYIAMSVSQTLMGIMRGAGDTMTPMWIGLITTVVIRVPLAYAIAYFTRSIEYPHGRPESIFISMLISWTMGAVISLFSYRRGNWRNKTVSLTG